MEDQTTPAVSSVDASFDQLNKDWYIDKAAQMYMGSAVMTRFLQTFSEYPPSQRADSWSIDKLTESFLKSAQQE